MDGVPVRAEAAAPQDRAAAGILLDDWAEEPPRPATARRRGFSGRSPLARRIVLFNVLALGALVVGILYLTRLDEALVQERERGVLAEARVLAQAIARFAGPGFGTPGAERQAANAEEAKRHLATFALTSANRVQLFDLEGRLLADSMDLPGAPPVAPARPALQGGGILDDALRRLSDLFDDAVPLYAERLEPGISSDPKVFRALEGRLAISRAPDSAGRLIAGAALPVAQGRNIVAAIVVSTRPGELDTMITGQRAQIMQVFGMAVLVSVTLSLLLANTIARPIQRLAEAAEQGEGRTSRLLNPQRIHIPDLTGRPDEIGYLSGAMRTMTEALYDRIEASEVFAAEVAHEIKNPLTSLRSAVETLRLARNDQSRERLMAVIEKDVIRLDRLVTDISNASRLDSEMVREEMETFSMTELLSNLVEFNGPKAEAQGARMVGALPEDRLATNGLEGRLAQVFVNLIANAISFTPEGGTVTVAAERLPDGGVRVSVSDTGPGIPDENLEDIFRRFYSERPKGDFGKHSGLGLAISKQIVDAHGGRIRAENIRDPGAGADAPRRGARFIVDLPQ